MTQGEHLRGLLKQAGLSQAELSRRSGVARETITKICSDKRGLGDDLASRLAPHLGVSVETLILPREDRVASQRGLESRLAAVEDAVADVVDEQASLRARLAKLEAARGRVVGEPRT